MVTKDYYSDDITFCSEECEDLECGRNKKRIRRPEIPHSFAEMKGNPGFCPKAEEETSSGPSGHRLAHRR